MCFGCGVLFDWTDTETKEHVKCIDDEGYCEDCADELEAKAMMLIEDGEEALSI